jgi:hypothetical protein
MKHFLLAIIGLVLLCPVKAQDPRVDTVAVMIIDHMASVIGELNSCSFTLNTSIDANDPDFGLITQHETDQVYLSGPNKMHINFNGDKGHRGFWFNGLTSILYSYDENNYVTFEAPETTIAMIDSINKNYGIEFPAADFFNPTITDYLLNIFDDLVFVGKKTLNGSECLLVRASNAEMIAEIWLSSDAFMLPQKFIIIYKNGENKQYEASFSNWNLNPDIPSSVFEFIQPPKARKISILPRTKS